MCMKRRTILIILVLISISACQNDNTVTMPESTAAVGSGDQIDPQETPTEITFDSLSPYRKGEELADKDPQFRLWAEPTVDDLVPPVSITCNGVDSRVYSPPYGLSVDNHCIVYSMNKATIALPDLSILMLDDSTELQVNIDGEGTEIIINQGGGLCCCSQTGRRQTIPGYYGTQWTVLKPLELNSAFLLIVKTW